MSPSSYSPQTYNRREESGKLQENGLISEGRLCSSFNKIVKTLLIVSFWKQVICFTQSPLALPVASQMLMVQSGSTCVQLMHLEGGTLLTHSTQILTQPTRERIC